jgi:4a-hydroxytetrahydrobiopterin dehydratase
MSADVGSFLSILGEQELLNALVLLPGWNLEGGKLVRVVTFQGFVEAIGFVNQVAGLAEQAAHHPDIDIRYSRVKLRLVTHDGPGGITEKDIALAGQISDLLSEQFGQGM